MRLFSRRIAHVQAAPGCVRAERRPPMKIILRKLFAPVLLALAVPASLLPAQVQAQSAVCKQPVTVQVGDTLSRWRRATGAAPLAYGRIVTASNAAAALDASLRRFKTQRDRRGLEALRVRRKRRARQRPPRAQCRSKPGTGTIAGDGAGRGRREDSLPIWHHRLQEAPHPLTIDYLRSQDYPGSPITVKRTLAPGSTTTATSSRTPLRGAEDHADRAAG